MKESKFTEELSSFALRSRNMGKNAWRAGEDSNFRTQVHSQDLVEFELFSVRPADGKVPTPLLPKIQFHRLVLEGNQSGAFDLLKGLVDVFDVEGNVVQMAVFAGTDISRQLIRRQLIEFHHHSLAFHHGHLDEAAAVIEFPSHDLLETQLLIKSD